jgi:hypothetical protein
MRAELSSPFLVSFEMCDAPARAAVTLLSRPQLHVFYFSCTDKQLTKPVMR